LAYADPWQAGQAIEHYEQALAISGRSVTAAAKRAAPEISAMNNGKPETCSEQRS